MLQGRAKGRKRGGNKKTRKKRTNRINTIKVRPGQRKRRIKKNPKLEGTETVRKKNAECLAPYPPLITSTWVIEIKKPVKKEKIPESTRS